MDGQAPGGQGRPPAQPQPTVPAMGAPAPPPAKKTPPIVFVALGLAVVLTAGIAFVGIMLVRSAGDRLSGPLTTGQCIDTGFGMDSGDKIPASSRVKCDDPGAKAKVLKITDEGMAAAFKVGPRDEPDCPGGTDGVTNVTLKRGSKHYYEACVRNIEGPHPGDPGAGGALLSAGDCVGGGSLGIGGEEKPCSGDDWYGKVIARADSQKSCPAETLETMKLRSWSGGKITRPVVCLGPGGRVLATGDCIEDPSFDIGGPDKTGCGTEQAVAKIVGRVKTEGECPGEATHVMTDDEAYLPAMCLKKLRPTLNDKIRSLGE